MKFGGGLFSRLLIAAGIETQGRACLWKDLMWIHFPLISAVDGRRILANRFIILGFGAISAVVDISIETEHVGIHLKGQG